MGNAKKMADSGNQNVGKDSSSVYYNAFVPKVLRDIKDNFIINQLQKNYALASKMADNTVKDYQVTITCDNSADFCKKGYYAAMNDGNKNINLCDKWFTSPDSKTALKSTADILTTCKKDRHGGLTQLQDFWFSKGILFLLFSFISWHPHNDLRRIRALVLEPYVANTNHSWGPSS